VRCSAAWFGHRRFFFFASRSSPCARLRAGLVPDRAGPPPHGARACCPPTHALRPRSFHAIRAGRRPAPRAGRIWLAGYAGVGPILSKIDPDPSSNSDSHGDSLPHRALELAGLDSSTAARGRFRRRSRRAPRDGPRAGPSTSATFHRWGGRLLRRWPHHGPVRRKRRSRGRVAPDACRLPELHRLVPDRPQPDSSTLLPPPHPRRRAGTSPPPTPRSASWPAASRTIPPSTAPTSVRGCDIARRLRPGIDGIDELLMCFYTARAAAGCCSATPHCTLSGHVT